MKVIIWVGASFEPWSPDTIDSDGMGGSEIAAWQVARHLVRLGHEVVVHAEADGRWGGVEFVNHLKAIFPLRADVVVASRSPDVFARGVEAAVKALWVHDVGFGRNTGRLHSQALKLDVVLALSEWHREHLLSRYLWLPPDLIRVTRNGVDKSRFEGPVVKIGRRMIYASSPDRGLSRLLDLMPAIRREVSGAELHVYYGFETWERIARLHDWFGDLRKIDDFKKRLVSTDGVVFHGRVGQVELAEAFKASRVWAYPTDFTETSCITAMEAQCAGCMPVTTRLAALAETVRYGVLLEPESSSDAYGKAFVSNVALLLKGDLLMGDALREEAMAAFDWAGVACQWEEIFTAISLRPEPRLQSFREVVL